MRRLRLDTQEIGARRGAGIDERAQQVPAGVLAVLNALSPGSFANPADPFERRAYSNRSTEQEIEEVGASMEINWDLDALGGATLTSISAWRSWETINGQDAEMRGLDAERGAGNRGGRERSDDGSDPG